ncbi:cytochrome bd-type quinol oxidase, subunit 1 [Pseudoalteromonas luteoviolacea 2ta16]|uniref:Cytochrome bd-type quinol oxidase, subunit 1 n=1 Tax=Pseudoalteromonas luteoviolacea (strain 2ta16) TaxID=1353533 RepID=V4HRK8_PSEL2|nr:cytochrome bd-type quinol oxidase, subunit 1 [Pseudoalteromonas luteoviolacea 2ta16]
MLDTLLLSRIQFATNISFHILFPTISIALAWFWFFLKSDMFKQTSPFGSGLIGFG